MYYLRKVESPCMHVIILTYYHNAVDVTISVTPGSSNIAGQSYGLECTANVNGSTDQPTITWLGPMNNTVPSDMVTTTGNMSTLTFNPLAASHAGTYTCSVVVDGVTETKTAIVSVNSEFIFSCHFCSL